ncbi:MAG: hypothetical protein ACYC27_23080 [Armatimonadota bacterium]
MFGRIRFTIAVILISISASVQAAPPPELQGYRISKIWDFSDSQESWVPDHNVSKFLIKDSLISFSNTGPDPWIINPKLALNTDKFSFLAIRMRSSNSGSNQIYFTTSESPNMGERNVTAHSVIGDGEFHVYTVDMSQLPTWNGTLTCLRIDTINGGQEVGAKVDIDWIALYQMPANVVMGRPYAGIVGDKIKIHVPVINTGGEPSQPGLVISTNGIHKEMDAIGPREKVNLSFTLPKTLKDIKISGDYMGKTLFKANLISPFANSDSWSAIGSKDTWVTYSPNTSGIMRIAHHLPNSELYNMGVFRPIGAIAWRDIDGVFRYAELEAKLMSANGNRIVLAAIQGVNGGTANIEWIFDFPHNRSDISMKCRLTSTVPVDILRFEGPRFLAGEDSFGKHKTLGLFPGLEYLEEDEPSSASWHIGPKYADRHVPHPYKVTIPVMAVEKDGIVAGMSWDPLSEWASGQKFESAEFESPNKSAEANNHLMTLFAPGIPDYLEENTEFAKNPYHLTPDGSMEISGSFFTESGQLIDVLSRRLTTVCPQISKGVEGTIENCIQAYTKSLYSAKDNGWKYHFGLHQQYGFNPSAAAIILGESFRKGKFGYAYGCKLPVTNQLSQYTGTTLDWFSEGRNAQINSVIDRQEDDGSFLYNITDEMKTKIKEIAPLGSPINLGKVGETNSGLIARDLNGILSYALQTGDLRAICAGIKGLNKLNKFTVPRGAQDWEVHVHAPDVYAAGLAVDANIMGYHLTGDKEYLQKARYWAYTGIPFVYDWVPPIDPVPASVWHFNENGEGKGLVTADPSEFYNNTKRYINPGATIAVFGTSFYLVNWFGNPVQWCGLAWSNSVRRYLKVQPDKTLESVADRVFASASQQQNEKGFLAGTYTDSWNLADNTTSPIYIIPDLILEHAYLKINEKRPYDIQYAGFERNNKRAYFNTYAFIDRFSASPTSVNASLRFYAKQDVYTCINRIDKPVSVIVDGVVLKETSDLVKTKSGFFYDKAHNSLHIKYRSSKRNAHLVVKW